MKKKETGFVMIVSLIFLVIMTMIGIFLLNGSTQDQKMAGNYREKNRALDAAQSALNYSELWLGQPGNTYLGNWVTGTACTTTSSTPVICNNALTTPASLPWSSYTTFTPAGMFVAASGLNKYSGNTNLYIQFLGTTSANPPTALYMATSTAKGGNDSAEAVVQTVYQVQATSIDIGGG
jgi:type IV pilus assembly protein PilX